MKKISSILASLPLITTACGGGGSDTPAGDNSTPLDLSAFKGTYSSDDAQTITGSSGNTFTFDKSTALITSDKQLAIITADYKALFLDPDTRKGKYFSSFTFIDDVDFSISESSNSISVNFTNTERGISGTLSLNQNTSYDTASSSADLAGT